MPTNRRPLNRRHRPVLGDEAIELFWKLEATPPRRRDPKDERRLASLLGLSDAFWNGCDVLDRSRRPCHPRGYLAYDNWFKVRRVREALLAAMGEQCAGSAQGRQ